MPFRVVSGVGRGMGVLDGVLIVEGEGQFFLGGGHVGRPIVTIGDFVAWLFAPVRGGDAALPKRLWGGLA